MSGADTYSRPERCAELRQARRIRDQIEARGGCALCRHRNRDVMAWGRSVCGLSPPRGFPHCVQRPENGRTFALDEAALDPITTTRDYPRARGRAK